MYAAALEGLVRVNGLVLDKDPSIPPVYESGARWRNIRHGNWRRADQICREGWGDCEGLSSWRTAELRRNGEDPEARVGVYHTGPRKYHAVVIRGDDTIEDPSLALGMTPPRRRMPLTRGEMNMVNGLWPSSCQPSIVIGEDDGSSPSMSINALELPDGNMAGQIRIPLADGGGAIVATTSAVAEKAQAAAKAANLLADLAKTVTANPMLLAKTNPYAAAALLVYSQPDVQKGLKALGGKAASLLKRLF
jgi:hypothetical protein